MRCCSPCFSASASQCYGHLPNADLPGLSLAFGEQPLSAVALSSPQSQCPAPQSYWHLRIGTLALFYLRRAINSANSNVHLISIWYHLISVWSKKQRSTFILRNQCFGDVGDEILDSITVYQFFWFGFNCQIKINSYDIPKVAFSIFCNLNKIVHSKMIIVCIIIFTLCSWIIIL